MAQADAAQVQAETGASALGRTDRRDSWQVGPVLTFLGLSAFIVYATARSFAGCFVETYHYGVSTSLPDALGAQAQAYVLSPFYSPLIALPKSLAWISPAFLILWAPGGFRVTCYYYRKAYYRAFFADPPACAVGEPGAWCGVRRGHEYRGETKLLLFQNLHRYFLYLALVFLVILSWDVIESCRWPAENGGHDFGVSVGTLVLAANVTLLAIYTFSCHSLRHLVGGKLDCFSRAPLGQARYKLWNCASVLNKRHMLWAWTSLFMVAFADFYVWMVARGSWIDWRIF